MYISAQSAFSSVACCFGVGSGPVWNYSILLACGSFCLSAASSVVGRFGEFGGFGRLVCNSAVAESPFAAAVHYDASLWQNQSAGITELEAS